MQLVFVTAVLLAVVGTEPPVFCTPEEHAKGAVHDRTFKNGSKIKVKCCLNDFKPAFCSSRRVNNTNVTEACQCRIIRLNTRKGKNMVDFCKYEQDVKMVVRQDDVFKNNTLVYGYPCEIGVDDLCPGGEFKEKQENKDIDCVPPKGYPLSMEDTSDVYKCRAEIKFDFISVQTCLRPQCTHRNKLELGLTRSLYTSCCEYSRLPPVLTMNQPFRNSLPEWTGYTWASGIDQKKPKRYCADRDTNTGKGDSEVKWRECLLLPFCSEDGGENQIKEGYQEAPLYYMVKAVNSTVDMDIDRHCQRICPRHLNIPGNDCQILPTCGTKKKTKDPARVGDCLPDCPENEAHSLQNVAECNRQPWCVHHDDHWHVSQKGNYFGSSSCTKRICERHETEFEDHCVVDDLSKSVEIEEEYEMPTVQSFGMGLFIFASCMVYAGIMMYPIDEADDSVDAQYNSCEPTNCDPTFTAARCQSSFNVALDGPKTSMETGISKTSLEMTAASSKEVIALKRKPSEITAKSQSIEHIMRTQASEEKMKASAEKVKK